MIYGYIRVSSTTQSIDRQLEEMYNHGLTKKSLYIDKQSGKDFNRLSYQKMIKKIKKDDLIVIKAIDRLGRDYVMIIEQWSLITKKIGADIMVIDMPLLDTRLKAENLMGKFISDIVLQVLSFVAQNERENIRQRQAEGIRIAKAKGIHMGRPNLPIPDNFEEVITKYTKKEITAKSAQDCLNMTKGTFYRNYHLYVENKLGDRINN